MKGIFRAFVQRGPAALSINTSSNRPYADEELDDGFRYAYRMGSIDQPDNRALRAAHRLSVPIVYFVSTRPGSYEALYPCFVTSDDPISGSVIVSPGRRVGAIDELELVPIFDELERRYAVRETRVLLHQARFRARVLLAYGDCCTICRLKETRLLDAAHITPDAAPEAAPVISNGLSLCSIHHRAFDQNLVGVSPDYLVHVSRRLLEEDDGPMLDLLKASHRAPILVPRRTAWQPDRVQLAARFELFQSS